MPETTTTTATQHTQHTQYGDSRTVQAKDDVVFFKSNLTGRFQRLSNFAPLSERLRVKGEAYPTLEHAVQAFMCLKSEERPRFQEGGELASFEGFEAALACTAKRPGGKPLKRPSHGLVGWVAKVAVNKQNSRKLALRFRSSRFDRAEIVGFLEYLTIKKYRMAQERALLLSTGDRYILEFDSREGERSPWGGKCVYKESEGAKVRQQDRPVEAIVGHNEMGKVLMRVRARIRAEMAK